MLDLSMKSIEWIFSGIGVAVLGAFGRWLWSKKGKNEGQSEAAAPSTASVQHIMHPINININIGIGYFGSRDKITTNDNSVQQTHSGSGDNVGRDKIVVTKDSSVHKSTFSDDNIGRDKIINTYLLSSIDYEQLMAEIKEGEELLALIAPERMDLRLKQSAKVEELRKKLEDFKQNVFRLHELFTRIPINTERLRQVKSHFDRGEFREADAVLNVEEIEHDVEFLRTAGYFEQALTETRTAKVLFEYARFLQEHNVFSKAEQLYQEALQYRRRDAAAEPNAFLPYVATILNNLANLHYQTQEYSQALNEYEEALKLYRSLAETEPNIFLQYVAGTLNNLANLHSDTRAYAPALKEYKEAMKLYRILAEADPKTFLPNVAMAMNNLANLHVQTKEYNSAMKEFEEAMKLYRNLAEAKPKDFLPDVVMTLINLSIFHLQAMPDRAKSVAYAIEARDILIPLCKHMPHLQQYLDTAEQVLAKNSTAPVSTPVK